MAAFLACCLVFLAFEAEGNVASSARDLLQVQEACDTEVLQTKRDTVR